jgi:competence protein ComEA
VPDPLRSADPTDADPDDPLVGSRPDDPLAVHRPGAGPLDRVLALADATGVSPGRLVAGALAIVAVAGAAAWSLRPPPAPPELDLPYVATTVAASPADEGPGLDAPVSTEAEAATEVVVHVAGAVRSPGVHRLPVDARVVDAVAAAGGLAGDADEARVNLASPLADGERVYVPRQGEDDPPAPVAGASPRPTGAPGSGPDADADVAPVDLNRATAVELEALPGVGPATAAAIVEHRDRVGAFTSVEQLLDVRGIGPAKLEQLRPRVTI